MAAIVTNMAVGYEALTRSSQSYANMARAYPALFFAGCQGPQLLSGEGAVYAGHEADEQTIAAMLGHVLSLLGKQCDMAAAYVMGYVVSCNADRHVGEMMDACVHENVVQDTPDEGEKRRRLACWLDEKVAQRLSFENAPMLMQALSLPREQQQALVGLWLKAAPGTEEKQLKAALHKGMRQVQEALAPYSGKKPLRFFWEKTPELPDAPMIENQSDAATIEACIHAMDENLEDIIVDARADMQVVTDCARGDVSERQALKKLICLLEEEEPRMTEEEN